MIDKTMIKAIAFDFGGTLDTPFMHWMDVYIRLYSEQLKLNLSSENFRDSYVYAEQMMERLQLVQPTHSLYETQLFKTKLQVEHLITRGVLPDTPAHREQLPETAARLVTDFSAYYVDRAKLVLEQLAPHYRLLLVSNYYGNVAQVVTDLGIADFFESITDSTLAGIRKPDAGLWKFAFDKHGYAPQEIVVVGDSKKNDILPALSLGCQAVQGVPALLCSAEHKTTSSSLDADALPVDFHCIHELSELITLLN